MTDAIFENELHIRAYIDQLSGYPFGHPGRINFKPMVPILQDSTGRINRKGTLELPCFQAIPSDQAELLLSEI